MPVNSLDAAVPLAADFSLLGSKQKEKKNFSSYTSGFVLCAPRHSFSVDHNVKALLWRRSFLFLSAMLKISFLGYWTLSLFARQAFLLERAIPSSILGSLLRAHHFLSL